MALVLVPLRGTPEEVIRLLTGGNGDHLAQAAEATPLVQLGRYLQLQDDGTIGVFWDRRFQDLRDCFIGGNLTSGSIGELGWSVTSSGSTSLTRLTGVSKHPGIIRGGVGGGSAGNQALHLGPSPTDGIFLNALDYADFLFRTSALVPDAVNSRSVAIGFGNDINAGLLGLHSVGLLAFPGSDQGLGFATNNWMAWTRSGGAGALQTTVDTGVLATGTTNWRFARIQRVLTGTPRYEFFIDSLAAPVASISTNFPVLAQNMGRRLACTDLNAGAHTFDWDEYYFRTDDQGSRIGP